MANLAHRASQFMDKKFLIIHPTADGRSGIISNIVTKSAKEKKNTPICLVWFLQKKSTFNIQRNSSPSSSVKRPTTPYRYALSLFPVHPGLWELGDPSGGLTAGRGLALHNAWLTHNEIIRPPWASCINTRTNPFISQCSAAECSSKLITDQYIR